MKTSIRITYNRYKKFNREGKAPIYIEVSFDRSIRKSINTKIYIDPKQWNEKKSEINNKYNSYIEANLYIREKVNEIIQYEMSLLNNDKILTPDLLESLLNGKKDNIKLFYKFALEEFNKEQVSLGTYRKIGSTLKRLEAHSPKLTFADIDFNYVKDIDNWLKGQKQITSLNTIANYHKILKKYIGLAVNTGLLKHEQNPYNIFKIKKTPTTRTNLTESQLETFSSYVVDNPFIKKIQDMFVFSCYTGLRYSDIVNLQSKHFEITGDDINIRIDKMVKTQKPVELPLNELFGGKPLVIFHKYFDENQNYLFGTPLTNQHINRELKFIARLSGIFHKDLTFHMARHTFGSLLAEKTGDPYLIKDLMGHSDIKMSMEYIHSSKKGRKDKLKKVDW